MPRTSTLAVTAALSVALVLAGCGGDGGGVTVSNQAPAPSVQPGEPTPAAPSFAAAPATGGTGDVSFAGVAVTGALDTTAEPGLTSASSTPAPGLLVKDLVVGTGVFATPTAAVTVRYKGILYADGTQFDADYDTAHPDPLQLRTSVSGFAQGVGGVKGVVPMRVGGRRLIVFPASLGYGAVPEGPIPAHASLVFVVDLLGVS